MTVNLERQKDMLDAAAGTLLPRGPFRRPADGNDIDLRAGRGPLVLLVMHSMECEPCRESLDTLAEHAADWADWGARVLGIAPAPRRSGAPRADADRAADRILIDTHHVLADGRAGMIVADEWGEIHFAHAADAGHELPAVGELVEWARFVSIQCPECEGPEGEWRSI